ncbi:P-II family nitrogen regulator [Clostridium minihomine]|uniref:P-II family nitrogen regulator n=1 Tax=Clostridium minihomine TaxID=2045012 RepID=UPI000C771B40|nr:transcriptional regulator [Clostridium minihomine]
MIAANQYNLIITIVNRGYSEQVMKAAELGGATGGTIVLARGVGNHEVENFLGISIQPEKEIILILTPRETKQQIMKSICQKCGFCTEARGMSFALPVDDALGFPITALEEQLNQEQSRKTGS